MMEKYSKVQEDYWKKCEKDKRERSPVEHGVIKPCPFCGGDNSHVEDAGFNHFAVRCRNGECKGQGLRDYDKQKAIDAWNKRAL